jgi:hypothetical protein
MKKLENVKFLFSSNWWDGPLIGLCEYENKYYWFQTYQDIEYDEEKDEWIDRIYKAYEIEPWQLSYELYWHSIFVSNVYRNAKCRTSFEEQLKNERFYMRRDFYKKRKKEYKEINYSNNNVIGTFKF